jgi:hypothetical protein
MNIIPKIIKITFTEKYFDGRLDETTTTTPCYYWITTIVYKWMGRVFFKNLSDIEFSVNYSGRNSRR